MYVGGGSGVRWVGWSTNLQSSFGVSAAFKLQLAEWLRAHCAPPEARPEPSGLPDDARYLARGTRVAGKRALVAVFEAWLSQSQAPTIGDVGSFGGRPWLLIDISGHEVALNADTKRAAVEAFVRAAKAEPDRQWCVVTNRRGRVNKVLPHPDRSPLPGWYAYLSRPLAAEGAI
jgi:hypothetical protein